MQASDLYSGVNQEDLYFFLTLFVLSQSVCLAEATRPNLLLIIADDLCRRDLG